MDGFCATVCKTVRPMLSDSYPVCLSVCLSYPVCNVGVLWPNGWMDQDATWYGDRPRPRSHYVIWGPSYPPPKGAQPPPNFRPMSFVAKRSPISATAEHLLKCKCWYVVDVTVDYSFERDCTCYVFSY